ncbi:hypothetical protein [Marivita sp.]|uniref:hypothetical protein n=1 Tax=Marivita sp. TaxID=2003365 RepID=UPI0025BC8C58|nr:hypothetical protein [Marivita sp.]
MGDVGPHKETVLGCVKGRINPSNVTKLRLFADSGGFCSNPRCLSEIFVDENSGAIHVGEIAHVISAGDEGPRSNVALTPEQRGEYENLILLCPRCHTIIDKAESDYSVATLLEWKENHRAAIADAFGARTLESRDSARSAVVPYLEENHYILKTYGPLTDERFNPESELPAQWLRKIRLKIIPNNRKILLLCEANSGFLSKEERMLLQAFKQHVDDFEAKHLGGAEQNGACFPEGFDKIFS